MAYRSLGGSKHARSFVSATLYIMLFGVSIVYLLLSSKILNDLVVSGLNLRFGECKMLVILSILIWPLIMCKSPQVELKVIAILTSFYLGLFLGRCSGYVNDDILRDNDHFWHHKRYSRMQIRSEISSISIWSIYYVSGNLYVWIWRSQRFPNYSGTIRFLIYSNLVDVSL
jgi:hypothetical protein